MIPDKVVKNKDKLVVSQGHWIDGNGPMEVGKSLVFHSLLLVLLEFFMTSSLIPPLWRKATARHLSHPP